MVERSHLLAAEVPVKVTSAHFETVESLKTNEKRCVLEETIPTNSQDSNSTPHYATTMTHFETVESPQIEERSRVRAKNNLVKSNSTFENLQTRSPQTNERRCVPKEAIPLPSQDLNSTPCYTNQDVNLMSEEFHYIRVSYEYLKGNVLFKS